MSGIISFQVLYSVPLVCLSVLVLVPLCLDGYGFVILPKVWESYASDLVFVPQDCFGNSGSFGVPCKFGLFVVVLCKMSWVI